MISRRGKRQYHSYRPKHFRVNLNEKVLTCDICNYQVENKHILGNHMALVHTYEKSECKLCQKVCENFKKLQCHMKNVHEKEEVFKCIICNVKSYKAYEPLRIHVENFHFEDITRTTFTCDICNMKIYSKLHLENHFASFHSRQFKCLKKDCNKFFIDFALRKLHHVSHHNRDLKVKCAIKSLIFLEF